MFKNSIRTSILGLIYILGHSLLHFIDENTKFQKSASLVPRTYLQLSPI